MKTICKRHGGKHYLAPWIVSNFPDRRTWHLYREPYFGGGSVLFEQDPDGISEAVNDKDTILTSMWDCIRDASLYPEFARRVSLTPFSEIEFDRATETLRDPNISAMDKAVACFIRARQSRQGIGVDYATPTKRLRRRMHENVSAWLSAVERLPEVHERIKRVEIRSLEACEFIRMYDNPQAFFYCDPPYLQDTRSAPEVYEYEMTHKDHCRLLNTLCQIKGKFMLSGYYSSLYNGNATAYGWRRLEKIIDNKASSKKEKDKKVECIWMNY